MKTKKRGVLIAVSVVALVIVLALVLWAAGVFAPPIEESFLHWGPVIESDEWETSVRESQENIELKYVGMEERKESGGFEFVYLTVDITNPDGDGIGYTEEFYLEYLHDGEWVCVYYPATSLAGLTSFEGNNLQKGYLIPAPTREGEYRLFIPTLGYCYLPKEA